MLLRSRSVLNCQSLCSSVVKYSEYGLQKYAVKYIWNILQFSTLQSLIERRDLSKKCWQNLKIMCIFLTYSDETENLLGSKGNWQLTPLYPWPISEFIFSCSGLPPRLPTLLHAQTPPRLLRNRHSWRASLGDRDLMLLGKYCDKYPSFYNPPWDSVDLCSAHFLNVAPSSNSLTNTPTIGFSAPPPSLAHFPHSLTCASWRSPRYIPGREHLSGSVFGGSQTKPDLALRLQLVSRCGPLLNTSESRLGNGADWSSSS